MQAMMNFLLIYNVYSQIYALHKCKSASRSKYNLCPVKSKEMSCMCTQHATSQYNSVPLCSVSLFFTVIGNITTGRQIYDTVFSIHCIILLTNK